MGTLSARRRRGTPRRRGVYTHPAQVPGVLLGTRVKRGARLGKRPKVIVGLRKGAMTNLAVKLGYIKEGQTISDIPNSKMADFGRDLARTISPGRAMRMVNPQIIFRKNTSNGFKTKMLKVKGGIRQESKVLKVKR